MEPVALAYSSTKASKITHCCCACRKTIDNIAAPDDDLLHLAQALAAAFERR
jgi:hypothetical protein